MANPALYVLDPTTGDPVLATDPIAYGQALLDPRRTIGSDTFTIPNGGIWIQTEFVGLDYDGSGRLWQTTVEWSSMMGRSVSSAHWLSAQDAIDGHATLLAALRATAAAMTAQANPLQPVAVAGDASGAAAVEGAVVAA